MQQSDVKGLTVGQFIPLLFLNFVPNINDGRGGFCGSHNFVPIKKVILKIFNNIPLTALRVNVLAQHSTVYSPSMKQGSPSGRAV
jgi:hypothetical protein